MEYKAIFTAAGVVLEATDVKTFYRAVARDVESYGEADLFIRDKFFGWMDKGGNLHRA